MLSPTKGISNRKLRLHYGGVWEIQPSSTGIPDFKWIGGSFVDSNTTELSNQTLDGLKNLFIEKCPLHESQNLGFSYLVGGIKWDINSDSDVKFVSKNIPPSSDSFIHIHCQSSLIIPEPQCYDDDLEGPPVDNTQPTQPTEPIILPKSPTQPKKLPVKRKLIQKVSKQNDTVDKTAFAEFEANMSFTEMLNMEEKEEDSYEEMLNILPGETAVTADSDSFDASYAAFVENAVEIEAAHDVETEAANEVETEAANEVETEAVYDGETEAAQVQTETVIAVNFDEIEDNPTRDIVKLVWHRFKVNIQYWKAWNARNIALEMVHGNYEDSYLKVPELCRQIQLANPDSVVQWECSPDTAEFEYLCISFKASIEGWKRGCRPVVGLDGCFLKGKYRGVALCAVGMDGNNGMFPLGIFICRKEEGESWNKFLELIAPELLKHHLPLTVMSDRAKGLIAAVGEHFSGCSQRFCFRHMFSNLSKKWKGEHMKDLCWAAASKFRLSDYKNAMEELDKAAVGVKTYLLKEQGAKTWARSHFDQVSKCDHLTNNFTESFNSFILSVRDKPVCSLVSGLSFLLMKIMYDRKRKSADWDENGFLPRVKKIIDAYKEKENDYLTDGSGNGTHCVRMWTGDHWTVDLAKQSCTCGEWQVTGIPCVHAVHLISHLRLPISNYINPLLSVKAYKAAYEENLKPIPHENDWANDIETNVLPPMLSRSAGRPRNNRIMGELVKMEKNLKNQKRCKKCGFFGHNSRSCQGGPTAAQERAAEIAAGRGKGRGRGKNGRGRGEAGISIVAAAGQGGGRGFVSSGRGTGNKMEPVSRGRASARTSSRGGRASAGTSSRGGRASAGTSSRGGRASAGTSGGRGSTVGLKRTLNVPVPPPSNAKPPSKKRKVFVPPSRVFKP